MFVQDDELLDITIFYKKNGKIYIAYNEKDFNENVKDESEKTKYKKLIVSMKFLNWGMYNELQDLATYFDEIHGRNAFNYKKYKEEKLKRLIVKWDAVIKSKDGKEVPAPINSNTIMSLAPNIAETIITTYDELSILSDDEEKK
jgi:hypothetical protein